MIEPQLKKGRKPKEKRYDTKFAKTLRTLLSEKEENGINLSTVADDLGITRQSLAQYRDGNNIPDIVILGRMAEYFNVSTDYLLGKTNIKNVNPTVQEICKLTGLSEDNTNELLITGFSNPIIKMINEILSYTMEHYPELMEGVYELCKYKSINNCIMRELNEREWDNKYSDEVLQSLTIDKLPPTKQQQYLTYSKERLEQCGLPMQVRADLYSEFLFSLFFNNMKDEIIRKALNSDIKNKMDELYDRLFATDNSSDMSMCLAEISKYHGELLYQSTGVIGRKKY